MSRSVKPAALRRDEILDRALELFASQGYEATSVNQIIVSLGLSKGAFYHHFAAKQDLIEALAARYADDATEAARPVLEDESLDAFSRLQLFLASMRNSKMAASVELRTFEPLFRDENLNLYQRSHDAVLAVIKPIFTRIIADGVAERTFDTPNPEWAAETILQMMGTTRSLICDLYHSRAAEDFDAVVEKLDARFVYLGTVIDRILGLPEGSVELTDAATMRTIADAWREMIGEAA
jgi:AcrR family transcriptional regulator